MKYLILNGVSAEELLNNCTFKDRLSMVKAHVYTSIDSSKFISYLLGDLEHYRTDEKNALFVVVTRDEALYREIRDDNLEYYLSKLYAYLAENSSTMVIVSFGSLQQKLSSYLIRHPSDFGGLCSINTISGSSLEMLFWKDEDKIINTGRCEILIDKNGIRAWDDSSSEDFDDVDSCYIVKSGYTPDRDIFKRVHECDSNDEIFEKACEEAVNATCFFIIRDKTQIEHIGSLIFRLRHSGRGEHLHIFVIERVSNIRANSENFLISCGANYVFTYDAQISHINVMLKSLHLASFKNTTALDFNTLKRQFFMLDRENNGYLDPEEFIRKVASMVSFDYDGANCNGALIFLKVADSIPCEVAVSEFKPKRGGDYCTIFNNEVVAFLPSCREGELEIGLSHTFNVEYDKLFTHVSATYSQHEIINLLHELKETGLTRANLNYTLLMHAVKVQKIEKSFTKAGDNLIKICNTKPMEAKSVNATELK